MYKIIFFAKGFPSAENPMAGNYEAVQAKAMARLGNHVSYLLIKDWHSLLHIFDKRKVQRRVSDGIVIYEKICMLPCLPFLPQSKKLNDWAEKRTYDRLYKAYLYDNGKPDICHVHMVLCCKCAAFLKEKYGVPFVLTEHWSAVLEPTIDDAVRQLGIDYYSKANRIIAVSQALSNRLMEEFGENALVINNMVEDIFFQNDTHKKNGDGKYHFIAVGRLCDHKHFDLLIESFAQAGLPTNTVLDIVGEGERHEQLKTLIDKNKLNASVIMHGIKSSAEVADMLASSDCYVLSSRLETFGIVLLEAMAMGLPVISTMCGGPNSFINENEGLLIPNNDHQAMSEALIYMRNNSEKYNAESIRQYCFKQFREEVIAHKIMDVYKSVLK